MTDMFDASAAGEDTDSDQIPEPTKEDYDAAVASLTAEEQDGPNSEAAEDEPVEEDRTPNRREARYRVQLREAEAERDQLRATVEALQRAEVERLAGRMIQKPGALWAANIALSDLLDDAGTVEPTKVTEAVKTAQKELGLAPTRPPGYVRGEGQTIERSSGGNAWEKAFTG